MNYSDSIREFFQSPKWMMNLLLAGVCTLIPMVGPIVLLGWLVGGFWGRDAYNPVTFPDFDFARFVDYLKRGLWPFLVAMVASLVFMPVIWIVCFIPMIGMGVLADGHGGSGHASDAAGVVVVFLFLLMMALVLALSLLMMLAIKPLMIRATLTQDFGQAFDFRWAMRFLKRTWLECVLAAAFLWVASLVLSMVGMLALCVGIYFVTGPIYFAMVHLDRQLYFLFLDRGGDPVPLSPKLRDEPPPVPAMRPA